MQLTIVNKDIKVTYEQVLVKRVNIPSTQFAWVFLLMRTTLLTPRAPTHTYFRSLVVSPSGLGATAADHGTRRLAGGGRAPVGAGGPGGGRYEGLDGVGDDLVRAACQAGVELGAVTGLIMQDLTPFPPSLQSVTLQGSINYGKDTAIELHLYHVEGRS